METTITIFAWIGLIAVFVLSCASLFLWVMSVLRESWYEHGVVSFSLFLGAMFWVAMRLRFMSEHRGNGFAAMVLHRSFKNLQKHEPEIARRFLELAQSPTTAPKEPRDA